MYKIHSFMKGQLCFHYIFLGFVIKMLMEKNFIPSRIILTAEVVKFLSCSNIHKYFLKMRDCTNSKVNFNNKAKLPTWTEVFHSAPLHRHTM